MGHIRYADSHCKSFFTGETGFYCAQEKMNAMFMNYRVGKKYLESSTFDSCRIKACPGTQIKGFSKCDFVERLAVKLKQDGYGNNEKTCRLKSDKEKIKELFKFVGRKPSLRKLYSMIQCIMAENPGCKWLSHFLETLRKEFKALNPLVRDQKTIEKIGKFSITTG